jgi:hypothetical protein
MPSRGYGIAFIAAALTFSSASAATITATTSKDNKTNVSLTGEIVEGDADKLKEIIRSANEAVRLVSGMRFDSPGGNLLEGVKLAGIIRSAKISTVVANGAKCASASLHSPLEAKNSSATPLGLGCMARQMALVKKQGTRLSLWHALSKSWECPKELSEKWSSLVQVRSPGLAMMIFDQWALQRPASPLR